MGCSDKLHVLNNTLLPPFLGGDTLLAFQSLYIWLMHCVIADYPFSPIQKSLCPNFHFCESEFQVTLLESQHPMMKKLRGHTNHCRKLRVLLNITDT